MLWLYWNWFDMRPYIGYVVTIPSTFYTCLHTISIVKDYPSGLFGGGRNHPPPSLFSVPIQTEKRKSRHDFGRCEVRPQPSLMSDCVPLIVHVDRSSSSSSWIARKLLRLLLSGRSVGPHDWQAEGRPPPHRRRWVCVCVRAVDRCSSRRSGVLLPIRWCKDESNESIGCELDVDGVKGISIHWRLVQTFHTAPRSQKLPNQPSSGDGNLRAIHACARTHARPRVMSAFRKFLRWAKRANLRDHTHICHTATCTFAHRFDRQRAHRR